VCHICSAGSCSVPNNICPGLGATCPPTGECTVRKLDDESKTYIGITTHPDAEIGFWKYVEFQNECDAAMLDTDAPRCFANVTTVELFDLKADEYELRNVASTAPPKLVAELQRRLRRYYPCKGTRCP